MANLKTIQFLRNQNLALYSDIEDAKTKLIAKAQELQLLDGSPIAGRYTISGEVRTVLGIVHVSGETTGVTFFNNDKEIDNVIENLDYSGVTIGNGVVLTNVTETDGVVSATSANVGNLKLTDYSKGSDTAAVAATDTINQAVAKLENQIDAEKDARAAAINALDYNLAADDNKIVVSLNQTDGAVSGTSVNISGIKLAGYAEAAATGDVATTDTLGEALGKLQKTIHEMDKDASAVDGQVVTTVSEADGVVSETKANVKDLQLGGYVKDTTATGDIASTDTVNAALSKLENKAAAITIANADGSINVTTGASGTDINVNIKSGEKVLAKDGNAGLYTDLDLVKITTGLPETIKERYQFLATDNSQIGTNIDIPKDSHIVSINYITTGEHAQNLEYVYIDASGNTQTTYVDMSELVLEAEFASGVTVTNHVVHGVVDPTSETFLTVGADGFKLAGVQDAIDSAVNSLDSTGGTQTIATGKHVAVEVIETDGKITAVNVAEDDIASATALTAEETARANADTELSNRLGNGVTTANTASAQLAALSGDSATAQSGDTSVEGAKKYADGKVAAVVANLDADVSGNSTHVTVGVVEADGVITNVTVAESNIANADDLADEIAARKAVDGQNGDTYAANTSANYISGATSLNDADVKLDAALKSADDAMLTGVAAGNGISVSTKSGKSQTITAVAKSSDPVIEVTSNGIGVKEDAVWDCGTF